MRTEPETPQEPAIVATCTHEGNDKLRAQIRENGPALCADQLWAYESGWIDSESSDDEFCGAALDFKDRKGQ